MTQEGVSERMETKDKKQQEFSEVYAEMDDYEKEGIVLTAKKLLCAQKTIKEVGKFDGAGNEDLA